MAKIIYYDEGTPKKFKNIGVINFTERTLKQYLDASRSAVGLFAGFEGTSVDDLISYSDTENVENVSYMFANCSNLLSIPELDFSKVKEARTIFENCLYVQRIQIKNIKASFYINHCNSLNREAIVEIFTNLGIVPNETESVYMKSDQKALLTEEDIAIATNKGWNISVW